MIKYALDQWNKNRENLRKELKESVNFLKECSYKDLVVFVVKTIINNNPDTYYIYDINNITEIDNGSYSGTLLYIIPMDTYSPSCDEYLMTYVDYGSCTGCDTLLWLQDEIGENLTDQNVIDFMKLCEDIVCNIIKPYNNGYFDNEKFKTVEY